MELKTYLRIAIAKWWIVLSAFLITFSAVLVFTFGQTPVYESSITYVVRIRVSTPDDRVTVSALDILSRDQVETTFAEVASSSTIKAQAANALGLAREQMRGISVNAKPLAGTNVLQIVVQGPDPVLVRDFASTVGTQTATYVRGLYGTYELQLLDQASTSSSPVKPRVTLNLLLGAVAGLVLGAGLALLAEYLQAPTDRPPDGRLAKHAEVDVPDWAGVRAVDERLTRERSRLLEDLAVLRKESKGREAAKPRKAG